MASGFYFGTNKKYFQPEEGQKKLVVEQGVWIPFAKGEQITYDKIIVSKIGDQRCTSLFNTIAINPYSEMFACCGLTAEYIPFFRLGNVKKHTVKEMYEQQFQDFLKIWLCTDGPEAILQYTDEKLKREKKKRIGHICFLCSEIFKNPENIEVIKKNYKTIMPSIMLKYSLLKSTL